MALNQSEIIDSDDLPRERVSCPEWGGDVWIGTLTADELIALQESFTPDGEEIEKREVFARTVMAAAQTEEGVPIFDRTPETLLKLRGKNAKVMLRLFNVAKRLNGIDETEDEAKKN